MVDMLERDVTENDAGAFSSSRTTRVRVTHVQRLEVSGRKGATATINLPSPSTETANPGFHDQRHPTWNWGEAGTGC